MLTCYWCSWRLSALLSMAPTPQQVVGALNQTDCFPTSSAQWAACKADPPKAPACTLEVVRATSPSNAPPIHETSSASVFQAA